MSQSSNFVAAKPKVERRISNLFDTNMTTGEAVRFARIIDITTEVNGEVSYGEALDKTLDLSADYTPVGTVDEAIQTVQIAAENTALQSDTVFTGGGALASIPDHANYAEIYVEDHGIRWVKDGSEPADNNGEQEMPGTTIRLSSRQDIEGFKAKVIDVVGDIVNDATVTSNLTVTYYNQNPA